MSKRLTSVDKALRVLFLLAGEQDLGVREIARRMDMTAATVHRLLGTLVDYGLVQRTPHNQQYALGWACVDLGRAAVAGVGIAQVGAPIAEWLRDQTRETVTIQVQSRNDQVCLFEAEGLEEIRRHVGVGRRMPLHAGASGRAILAYLPPDEVDRYLGSPLRQVVPNTTTDRGALEKLLATIRRTGIAVSRSESVEGAAAISVPIFGEDGLIEGSISISGPASRLTAAVVKKYGPLVAEAGQKISQNLGYLPASAGSQERRVDLEPRQVPVRSSPTALRATRDAREPAGRGEGG